jgi:glycosyltransferase involved in cell wall biosynthesis
MRVLFDASPTLFMSGGIVTHIEQLVPALRAFSELQLYRARIPPWIQPQHTHGFKHKLRAVAWNSAYLNYHLLKQAHTLVVDVLHLSAVRAPIRNTPPLVVTIHDIIPRILPIFCRLEHALTANFYLWLSTQRASQIITISEVSRQDIHRYYKVPLDRITVTPLATGAHFTPQTSAAISDVCSRYGINVPYVLSVCNIEPRKNLPRLLRAFADLRQRRLVPHKLVLVGREGRLGNPLHALAVELGIADFVHFTGFIPDQDLAALYAGADLFAYIPIYEGFGLPPLEAMACGTPTLSSNTSSLPEVVGDAGELVDPYDTNAISTAMERVLYDDRRREQLRERGLARARLFSWERCARETIAVYQQALKSTT